MSPVDVGEAVAPSESDAVLVAEGGTPEMEGSTVAAADKVMEGVGGMHDRDAVRVGEAEERAEGETEGELDWDGDGVRLSPVVGLKDADSDTLAEGKLVGERVGEMLRPVVGLRDWVGVALDDCKLTLTEAVAVVEARREALVLTESVLDGADDGVADELTRDGDAEVVRDSAPLAPYDLDCVRDWETEADADGDTGSTQAVMTMAPDAPAPPPGAPPRTSEKFAQDATRLVLTIEAPPPPPPPNGKPAEPCAPPPPGRHPAPPPPPL